MNSLYHTKTKTIGEVRVILANDNPTEIEVDFGWVVQPLSGQLAHDRDSAGMKDFF